MRFIRVKGGVMDLHKNPYVHVQDGRAIEIRKTLTGMTYEYDLGIIENDSDDVVALLNQMVIDVKQEMINEITKLKQDIKRGVL